METTNGVYLSHLSSFFPLFFFLLCFFFLEKHKFIYPYFTYECLVSIPRWQGSVLIQSREVSAQLTRVLEFPDGWMDFGDDEDESGGNDGERRAASYANRRAEVDYLRRTCLVEVVFLLHSVLHETKQYKKAIQLSDIVARPNKPIYTEFSQEDMTRLLTNIRESAILSMDEEKTDAFGY